MCSRSLQYVRKRNFSAAHVVGGRHLSLPFGTHGGDDYRAATAGDLDAAVKRHHRAGCDTPVDLLSAPARGNNLEELAVGRVGEGEGRGRQTADAVVNGFVVKRKVNETIGFFNFSGVGGKGV